MFDMIKKSFDFSGKYKLILKRGIFFIFFQNISVLLQFVTIFLGFSWWKNLDTKKILILFVILIISMIFNFIGFYNAYSKVSGTFFTIFKDLREEAGEKLKSAPMGYFSHTALSHILSALTMVIKTVEQMLGLYFNFTFTGLATTIFLLLGLFGMHIYIGVIALIFVILSYICLRTMYRISAKETRLLHDTNLEFSDAAIEGIRGIPVLRSFPQKKGKMQEKIHQEFYRASEAIVKNQIDLEKKFIITSRIYGILLYGGSIFITLLTYNLYSKGLVEAPKALTLCAIGFMLFGGLRQLENVTILGSKTPHEMEYLEEVLNIPQMKDGPIKEVPFNSDIVFENVSFGYEKGEKIIKNMSFIIKAKEKVAIVGPSGSGKTTIINLIARFYDPDEGSIKFDGKDIREYEVSAVLRNLSLVFQNVYLFNDSILNNIKIANSEATKSQIIEAAKKAHCHEFISELNEGYETEVGEEGSRFSGGERQRISIARALLKDAPVILLDEATSSVDPENEGEILSAIRELTKDKTVISIAHRLSTVKDADKILVIDDGKLVQMGTHENLMKEEGIYKKFINAREKAQNWKVGV